MWFNCRYLLTRRRDRQRSEFLASNYKMILCAMSHRTVVILNLTSRFTATTHLSGELQHSSSRSMLAWGNMGAIPFRSRCTTLGRGYPNTIRRYCCIKFRRQFFWQPRLSQFTRASERCSSRISESIRWPASRAENLHYSVLSKGFSFWHLYFIQESANRLNSSKARFTSVCEGSSAPQSCGKVLPHTRGSKRIRRSEGLAWGGKWKVVDE